MFGLSGEHLLILAGVLLIFGPRKLPELGASLGKALRNFKEGFNAPTSSGTLASEPQKVLVAEASDVALQSPIAATSMNTANTPTTPVTAATPSTPPTV